MDLSFHFSEHSEDRHGTLFHARAQIRSLQTSADLPKKNVVILLRTEVPAARLALAKRRLFHQKAQSGKRMVAMFTDSANDAARKPGCRDCSQHAFAQVGESIEHSSDEHVARYAADGIEVDMH